MLNGQITGRVYNHYTEYIQKSLSVCIVQGDAHGKEQYSVRTGRDGAASVMDFYCMLYV